MTPSEQLVTAVLTSEQLTVMRRVLAEEQAKREHVVIALTGAHAYGFPSPDSDLDLKAIHVVPTEALLGFSAPSTTVDRMEVLDGVEIDYTSNELAHVLSGILGGNGNFIERVLGQLSALASPLLEELRPLTQRALCRRVHRHYRGFAVQQRRNLEKEPTVKKLLYVLRTASTGIGLLETGRLVADLRELIGHCGLERAEELIEQKRAGERVGVDPSLVELWQPRIDGLLSRLDDAHQKSVLPEAPPNEPEALAWLIGVRRTRL